MPVQPAKLAKSILEAAYHSQHKHASQKQVGNKIPQVNKPLGESVRQSSVPSSTTALWLTEL